MRRLVFIDDDKKELQDFTKIVEDDYECTLIHWPAEEARLFGDPGPDIFVSDLYLPPSAGDTEPSEDQVEKAARVSREVRENFSRLYKDSSPSGKVRPREGIDRHKRRLRDTMNAIGKAYKLLELQWRALGQSPKHGVWLLTELRRRFAGVPFVFYSRKITPEDVICVLRAGAVDAIRKGAFGKHEVLSRLRSAEEVWQRGDIQEIRVHGLNVNVTAVPRA